MERSNQNSASKQANQLDIYDYKKEKLGEKSKGAAKDLTT